MCAVKYLSFLHKHVNTNHTRGPIHYISGVH